MIKIIFKKDKILILLHISLPSGVWNTQLAKIHIFRIYFNSKPKYLYWRSPMLKTKISFITNTKICQKTRSYLKFTLGYLFMFYSNPLIEFYRWGQERNRMNLNSQKIDNIKPSTIDGVHTNHWDPRSYIVFHLDNQLSNGIVIIGDVLWWFEHRPHLN